MPIRNKFTTGETYHLYNRGVRKTDIFNNDSDRQRFLNLLSWYQQIDYPFSMYLSRLDQAKQYNSNPDEIIKSIQNTHHFKRNPIQLYAFALMDNHFHLVVHQNIDDGISSFMHQVSTAYSMYFNRKYGMSGTLFEGTFKSVQVSNEDQFTHLCRYIHLNPVAGGMISSDAILSYSWTSLPIYLATWSKQDNEEEQGNKSNPDNLPLLDTDFLLNQFKSKLELKNFMLAEFKPKEIESVKNVIIDNDFSWSKT